MNFLGKITPLSSSASIFSDILRSLLAQLVLIGHAASFFGVLEFTQPPYFPWVQSIAVVGFFWLSGFFLCYSTLSRKLNSSNYQFRDFFVDRFARIYSAYFPAIVMIAVIDILFIQIFPNKYQFYGSFEWGTAVANLLMLQKYPLAELSYPMFGSASTWWTLGIEWWLYMFFGWVFLASEKRQKNKKFYLIALMLAVVPINYAFMGTSNIGHGLSLVWFLACLLVFMKEPLAELLGRRSILFGIGLFFVLTMLRYKISMDAYDIIAALYFGLFFLLVITYLQDVECHLSDSIVRVIRFFAGYSFTLFLTHYSLLYLIAKSNWLDGWGAFAIGVLLSNIIGAMLAWKTEIQHRKLAKFIKKKFRLV